VRSVQHWVESSDPLWRRDPALEQMKVDFRRALARLVPVSCPTCCSGSGATVNRFSRFAAAIVPTEFLPGRVFEYRHDASDRLLRRAGRGQDRSALNLDLATIQQQELAMAFGSTYRNT
jgi:hypothetical protein